VRALKIFECADGGPRTLFHGVGGSRRLPVGRWLAAEKRPVVNGSGTPHYISVFHAYLSLDDVRRWGHAARNNANRVVVVEVELDGVRDKPNAVWPTLLADRMRIGRRAWARRVPLQELLTDAGA
jgi:hypothetical protein